MCEHQLISYTCKNLCQNCFQYWSFQIQIIMFIIVIIDFRWIFMTIILWYVTGFMLLYIGSCNVGWYGNIDNPFSIQLIWIFGLVLTLVLLSTPSKPNFIVVGIVFRFHLSSELNQPRCQLTSRAFPNASKQTDWRYILSQSSIGRDQGWDFSV